VRCSRDISGVSGVAQSMGPALGGFLRPSELAMGVSHELAAGRRHNDRFCRSFKNRTLRTLLSH